MAPTLSGARPGDLDDTGRISPEELQLAARNHGMPLEALRYPITPPGLHYLLIHYDVPAIDPAEWRLDIGGAVRRPLSLDLDTLRDRTRIEVTATMECAGNGRARLTPRPVSQPWLNEAVGTARWAGVSVAELLGEAGLADEAVEVVFTGADRGVEGGMAQCYERALPLSELRRPELVLAYEMNGAPLLPQHGAPLRLVAPGWYGMANVKWLTRLTAVTEPFDGYQHRRSYRFRRDADDPGTPVSRMRPRALLAPPGIPDFFTRRRFVPEEACLLEGRAWSGSAPVDAVLVSTDGGATWAEAELEPDTLGPWAWRGWRFVWEPPGPGDYRVLCCARDASGAEQQPGPGWNRGGYANADPHELLVTVGPAPVGDQGEV